MRWLIVTILSLIYVASPIDFVPEALLGPVGLTDDALAAALGIFAIFRMVKARKRARAAKAAATSGHSVNADSTSARPTSSPAGEPIETTARVVRD